MNWQRTAPVQPVGALFAEGEAAAHAVTMLAGKSALFRSLPIARGEDWIILFAGPVPGAQADDPATILPSLPGTRPLYTDAEGWWLPVGVEWQVPVQARGDVRQALVEAHGVPPPLLILPKFAGGADTARTIHLYPIRLAAA